MKKQGVSALLTLFALLGLAVNAAEPAKDPTPEEKVQKITFKSDDDQNYIVSKVYELKNTKAADLAPFVRSAALRYDPVSTVASLADVSNKRQMLVVSTAQDMMPYIDEMIAALDRPGRANPAGSIISGTGIAYGTYNPKFRSAESMRTVVVEGEVSSGSPDSKVKLDKKTGMFYYKDTPFKVADITKKLQWLDKPVPQAQVELKIYEVRDSDLLDLGVDYVAWKNGPGLDLFSAGFNSLNARFDEWLFSDVASKLVYNFGGFYFAPSFDFSFIRLLQQNGRAVINSTATVTISNTPGATFSATFAPEYQNILKGDNHQTSVEVGGESELYALITNPVITGGAEGVVSLKCGFIGSNVVERNTLGTEISEKTVMVAAPTLEFNKEKLLVSWNRTSKVEQTIGVPFLCELPILKYIFGTTTSNQETTHYFVTAKAIPVSLETNAECGVMTEFDELVAND